MVIRRFGLVRLIVCVLPLLLFLSSCTEKEKASGVAVEYRLLFSLPVSYAEAFEVGAPLLDGVSKELCGKVLAVESQPFMLETARGVKEDPARCRLIVTVRAEGRLTEGGLSIGSLSPILGRRFFIHAPCVADGICLGGRLV